MSSTNDKAVSSLHAVIDERRQEGARRIRAALFQRCRAAIDQVGDDIAGSVLVVWDKEGDMRSAYDASCGPIRAPLVPTVVADVLDRYVAATIAAARQEEG